MIDHGLRDLRQALRALLGNPRYTALALAAFAIGTGANTAIFDLLDDAFLDALPWPNAGRAVTIWERYPEGGADRVPAAPAKILEWREEPVFQDLGLYRTETLDYAGPDGPERLAVGLADSRLFPLLGLSPRAGRFFSPDDVVRGNERVVVLTHAFWTTRFGQDEGVLGTTLELGGARHEVIGVLRPGDAYPDGVDVWIPLVIDEWRSRTAHGYRAVGLLAAGVDVETADRRIGALAASRAAEYPETDSGWEAYVTPLRSEVVGDLASLLLLLQSAVALVLVVAAANAASILLVHAASRGREMAVRAALGAGRARLVRQLLAESVLLASAGGVVGYGMSRLGVDALRSAVRLDVPSAGTGSDATVALFTAFLALASGLLFGILPALRGTSGDVAGRLRDAGNTVSVGQGRVRRAIVAAEVALAALLLVASGLVVRSLEAVSSVDPGFDVRGVLVASVQPPRSRYPGSRDRAILYRSLVEAMDARPELTSVAAVSHLPLGGRQDTFRFHIEGRPIPENIDVNGARLRAVTPDYLDALRIDLLRGRPILASDVAGSEEVALVNAAMARRFWPDEDAIGARVSLMGPEGPWIRVVGVVADVRASRLTTLPEPAVYRPMDQESWPAAWLVARVDGDAATRLEAMRAAAAAVDPSLALGSVRTGESLLADSTSRWRAQAFLVTLFALTAAVLAVLGVFGLLSYVVHQRHKEMAIRRALGARDADVRRLVGSEALALTLPGIAVGLLGGALVAHLVRSLLYGVGVLDPVTYGVTASVLVVAVLAAAWPSARRAAAVEPAGVLRGS